MNAHQLSEWLDDFLHVAETGDFPGAHNGLHVESPCEICKVAVAVDACEAVLAEAVRCGAQLLIVHHGLLWGGAAPWRGPLYRKLRLCVENGLAVYSSHLPLDAHPLCGNNAVLARKLGMPPADPFLEIFGTPCGLVADWEIPLSELLRRVEEVLGAAPHVSVGGPGTTRRVAISTGASGAEIARVAAAGVDTFLTGEGPHHTFTAAEELGVNLLYGGHYATETFGVRALGEILFEKFGLDWQFIDHPTGL